MDGFDSMTSSWPKMNAQRAKMLWMQMEPVTYRPIQFCSIAPNAVRLLNEHPGDIEQG